MPDLPDRQRRETELAAAILLLFRNHERAAAIGLPLIHSIPPAMVENLSSTFRDAAQQVLASKVANAATQAEAESLAWAMHRANAIVNQVTTTDVRGIQRFDQRADMVGATETTAAITAGETFATWALLSYHGVTTRTTWYSEMDSRTCDDCYNLHGTGPEVYDVVSPGGPPLHPFCRCWLEHEVVA